MEYLILYRKFLGYLRKEIYFMYSNKICFFAMINCLIQTGKQDVFFDITHKCIDKN
jgi:hypothetical protein